MKTLTFLSRLQEPSSWAGLAALGALVGLSPDVLSLTGQVVMGVAGLLAIVLPEARKGV